MWPNPQETAKNLSVQMSYFMVYAWWNEIFFTAKKKKKKSFPLRISSARIKQGLEQMRKFLLTLILCQDVSL